jgi:hypothetical protein
MKWLSVGKIKGLRASCTIRLRKREKVTHVQTGTARITLPRRTNIA